MFTKRFSQPSKTLTAIIVFAGGIISGAALAAGQQPQEVRNAMAMFEESVAQPSEVGVPAQPKAVVAPVTQVNSAVQQPSAPQGSSVTAVAKPALAQPQEAPVVAQPVAEVAKRPTPESSQSFLRQEDTSPLANAEPAPATIGEQAPSNMTDNASFLLVIIIAMMGGAALLAHRKQIRATGDGEDLTLEVARSIRLGAKLQLSLVRVPGRLLVVGATDKGVELLTELFPGDEEDVDDSFLASAFAKREEASERGHQAIQREELLPEPIMAPRHTPLTPEPVAEPRIERKTKPRRPVSSDVGKRTVVDSVGVYSRPGKRVQRDEPTPAPRAHRAATKTADHDDAFLDSMLERLSNARPAVAERSSRQQTKTDERAALRARVKQYRRGPTRL